MCPMLGLLFALFIKYRWNLFTTRLMCGHQVNTLSVINSWTIFNAALVENSFRVHWEFTPYGWKCICECFQNFPHSTTFARCERTLNIWNGKNHEQLRKSWKAPGNKQMNKNPFFKSLTQAFYVHILQLCTFWGRKRGDENENNWKTD